jgi:hypothetical protein
MPSGGRDGITTLSFFLVAAGHNFLGITTLSFFLVAAGQNFLTQFDVLFLKGHRFVRRCGHDDENRGGLGGMWVAIAVMEGDSEYQDGVAMTESSEEASPC